MSEEMLLITSKTKTALQSTGLKVSSNCLQKINEVVHELVKNAQRRCKENGRKTIKDCDF